MRGATEYLNGRFRTAVEFSDRAASIFRDRCVGATWEIDTASWFAVTARFYMGQYRELDRQLNLLVHDARVRGDFYASTLFSTLLAQSAFLAADQPERAMRELQRAREQWPGEGFHIQHYWLLLGEGFVDLYMGNAARAWERVVASWPAFLASQLPRLGMVNAQMLHLRGTCALGAATQAKTPSDAAALLREADRAAGELLRSRIVPFRPTGLLLRAGIHSAHGERARAGELLAKAAEGFERAKMALYASVARRRHAELAGRPDRDDRVAAEDECMVREGIRNPVRFARILIPALETAGP